MSTYKKHTDLPVYQASFDASMEIFRFFKPFPKEATYSLTDQVRRSSKSVSANIAEAWRKRRSEAHFISTLNVADAAETQVWIQFGVEREYLAPDQARSLYATYDEILAQIVTLIRNSTPWILNK